MNIEFDGYKNQVNIAKHGVSLGMASQLDWEQNDFVGQYRQVQDNTAIA